MVIGLQIKLFKCLLEHNIPTTATVNNNFVNLYPNHAPSIENIGSHLGQAIFF
jgi:hypothetical protein